MASLVVQTVKSLPVMQKTWVQSQIGKIPWRREWQPTPVFLPRECHGQRRLEGYSPWACEESGMTEQRNRVWMGRVGCCGGEMSGHVSMLAVSGRGSSCCSTLLFKAEFFSFSIASTKERADLSLCDHSEHPSTFKHSWGKPRLAGVCQASCFPGASGMMKPHPSLSLAQMSGAPRSGSCHSPRALCCFLGPCSWEWWPCTCCLLATLEEVRATIIIHLELSVCLYGVHHNFCYLRGAARTTVTPRAEARYGAVLLEG